MACSDVDGNFEKGLLFIDGTDDFVEDSIMRITQPPDANGVFSGNFDGDTADFDGECRVMGQRTMITITRTRNDGTKTTYKGRVKRVVTATVNKTIIRGRFDGPATNVVDKDAALAGMGGDWETEKPT
jgi:hypothetical protein